MIKWSIVISYFFFVVSCFGPSQSYPTSQQIAFVSSRDGNFEIYSMDINGFNQINLSQNGARDKYPQFSPDGSKLVFASDREGDYDIFIMTLDWYGGYIRYKGIELINLSSQLGNDLYPEFSSTGLEIVFESLLNDNYEIFTVDTLGNNKTNLTENIGQDRKPKFSSDGQHIVFWSNRDGNDEIYIPSKDANKLCTGPLFIATSPFRVTLFNNLGGYYIPNHFFHSDWDFWLSVYEQEIIGNFEHMLESTIALAAFIPVIIGMGGNIGTQSSTIVVRGIATGRVEEGGELKLLFKVFF